VNPIILPSSGVFHQNEDRNSHAGVSEPFSEFPGFVKGYRKKEPGSPNNDSESPAADFLIPAGDGRKLPAPGNPV